jgi:hypothetical protein
MTSDNPHVDSAATAGACPFSKRASVVSATNASTHIRRRAVLVSLAGMATAGCDRDPSADRQLRFSSLAQASEELAVLASAKERVSATGWNWAQTLLHCAQSIEYSLTGFPQPRSRVFQATVGSAAFAIFESRGRMSHDLTEPIPGAPALEADAQERQALERLRTAVETFMGWQKQLQPHFAYGPLTKSQYELAHSMHLANHLSYFHGG